MFHKNFIDDTNDIIIVLFEIIICFLVEAVNIVADRMHSTLGQQVSKPQIMEALQANNYNSNETTLQLLMKKGEEDVDMFHHTDAQHCHLLSRYTIK